MSVFTVLQDFSLLLGLVICQKQRKTFVSFLCIYNLAILITLRTMAVFIWTFPSFPLLVVLCMTDRNLQKQRVIVCKIIDIARLLVQQNEVNKKPCFYRMDRLSRRTNSIQYDESCRNWPKITSKRHAVSIFRIFETGQSFELAHQITSENARSKTLRQHVNEC